MAMSPSTKEQFLDLLRRSGLIEEGQLHQYLDSKNGALPEAPRDLARTLVQDGLLTNFQAGQLLAGKSRRFVLGGKYKLLEHLGSGGMGSVYLCEHTTMRRRVAIKVLPLNKAKDPSYLERFYREARAVAALDHPNIVRAHDIDHEGSLHFLVMEYVDGTSLQDIVGRHGPLGVNQAAHYLSQSAWGLQHAFEAGLVHRDIKPGNILVDRAGTVKILDMGLARFFNVDDNLSKKYDETVLGTSDYLAPEQTLDSNVDIRADIYSLGATFYFCLTGHTLFEEGTVAQKLIWHQTRQPKPIRSLRPEVPEELAAVIEQRMLAKDPAQRFLTPIEIVDALAPWTAEPIAPPPEEQMPQHCKAAQGTGQGESSPAPAPALTDSSPSGTRRPWTVAGALSPRPGQSPGVRRAPGTGVRRAGQTPTPLVGAPTSGVAAEAGDNGRPDRETAVQETAPTERSPGRPAPSSAKFAAGDLAAGGRNLVPLIAAAALVVIVLLAGTAIGLAWALGRAGRGPVAVQPPPGPAAEPDKRQSFYTEPAPATQARPAPQPAAAAPGTGAPSAEGVTVQAVKGGGYQIHAPKYDAVIEPDGCLTSLRTGGVEWLRPGLDISRGLYLHQEDVNALKLPNLELSSANVVTAKGDRGSIRYEFGPDTLRWTPTNATDKPMNLFIVFSAALDAVANDKGEVAGIPVKNDWGTTTWYADEAKLHITGGNAAWPWTENAQVWQAVLQPHETRPVTVQVGTVSDEEANRIAAATGSHRVKTAGYVARVEKDGCLTSLRAGGVEWLWAGGTISRGSYFFKDKAGALKLPDVKEVSSTLLTAEGDLASIRYDFAPGGMTWTVKNKGTDPLTFFLVFSPEVKVVANDKGEYAETPTTQEGWQKTTWFAGSAKITIDGSTRLWGPFDGDHQVWHLDLKPGESRQIKFEVGTPTPAEKAKVTALLGGAPPTNPDLPLASPLDYQVFQRYARYRGQISLKGEVKPECSTVEVRVTGTPQRGKLPDGWQEVDFDKGSKSFDATLPLPAGGWYKVEVRARKGQKVVAETEVDHVGVGEVFVIAGQSNATNCGEERLKPQSGMVATFSGKDWRPAKDPQPGVHDKTGGGSPWPAFGDALYEKEKVPVGIASTGHSGSSVRQWQPGSEYFNWMLGRIKQLGTGGFRAVLWHQGESDVDMAPDQYAQELKSVIVASKKEAGWDFPWFVAQASYHNPGQPKFEKVRAGQKKLWDEKAALEGPDTDTLTGDNRDQGGQGIHFSGKGLRAHGKLWAKKVAAYLDKALAE
jgi:serine/threonine protein kinase